MPNEPQPDLNDKEQEFRIRKLELETKMLTYQSQPRHLRFVRIQAAASIASFITAGVAVIALCASSLQWFTAQRQARDDKVNERLESSLTQLSNPTPTARLAAVVALRSFLEEPNERIHYQVLRAYISTLSIDDSNAVRTAIVSALGSINGEIVPVSRRQVALTDLISQNRAMTKEGNLSSIDDKDNPRKEDVFLRAQSVVSAITLLLHAGCTTQDFSDLFLGEADFHGLDLSHANFDRSTLYNANFEDSVLNHASFNYSELFRARFNRAKLQYAKITQRKNPSDFREDPLTMRLGKSLKVESLSGDLEIEAPFPYFTDADLSNAELKGFPILPVRENGCRVCITTDAIFRGANLAGADFREAALFGLRDSASGFPIEIEEISEVDLGKNNLTLFSAPISQEGDFIVSSKEWSNYAVGKLFEGADTSKAKFDAAFKTWAGL